jgi:lauroyl/myristoyl acyltransferase
VLGTFRALRGGRGGIVALIADLHRAGMRGHVVRFLDAGCILPGGPAAIARLAQAPLIPFAVYPNGERRRRQELGIPIEPPIPWRARPSAWCRPGRPDRRAALRTRCPNAPVSLRARLLASQ